MKIHGSTTRLVGDDSPLVMFDLDAVTYRSRPIDAQDEGWNYRRVELPDVRGGAGAQLVRWVPDEVITFIDSLIAIGCDVAWVGEGASPGHQAVRGPVGLGGLRCIYSPNLLEMPWDSPISADFHSVIVNVRDEVDAQPSRRFIWVSSLLTPHVMDEVLSDFGSRALVLPIPGSRGLNRADLMEIAHFLGRTYTRAFDQLHV